MGAEAAARLGDEIAHGTGLVAMLGGAVVGALVGAAILAAAPVSLGIGAVILGGSVAAGALSMKQLVKGISTVFKLPEPSSGTIMIGSNNTFINGRPAARAGRDLATPCTGRPLNHREAPAPVLLEQGSGNVYINGQPVSRLKDKLVCGAHIKTGSQNVFIGGGTQGTGHAIQDLENWVEHGFESLGVAALVGAGALAAAAGMGAFAIFGAVACGFNEAFKGIGKLGDRLGPGYSDMLQGAAGLGTLLAGPRFARSEATSRTAAAEHEIASLQKTPGPPNGPPSQQPVPQQGFSNQDEAARAAIDAINPKSVQENLEYGGMVYQHANGTYDYTGPIKGTIAGVDPGGPKAVPQGTQATAYWHTHGGPDPRYNNEVFSGTRGDIGYADHYKIDGYLGTPAGSFQKYDHATRQVIDLGKISN